MSIFCWHGIPFETKLFYLQKRLMKKQMHYSILFSILLAVVIANLKQPARSAEPELKKTASEAQSTERIKNIHVNAFINFKDSTERQKQVARFYNNRNNDLAWFKNGKLNKNGRELISRLEKADEEGLSPSFYNLQEIKSEIANLKLSEDENLYQLASLDLKLTNAYINFASDISSGRVDPGDLNVIWETNSKQKDFSAYLRKALENQQVAKSLTDLRPHHKQYVLLLKAYQKLSEEKNEGAWILPGKNIPTLEENDSVTGVIRIKKRLASSGYLVGKDSSYINSPVFDEQLTFAVKNFQRDHGLEADGVVGKNTLSAMNKPIEYRLAQIRLNIDRLRWLPDNIGDRDIIVNIPDYKLQYFENNELVHEMGVIVGKTTHYTPALKDTITYIVLNPTWNVPYSIATEEMLPKIKTDTSYLSRNNYKLVRGSYASNDVVNPASVDWSEITASNFPFSIIQKPGNSNALGRVKFMLPNNHSIYLHDTPADYLFNRNERDFSHGCVRLEKPFELAETILDGQMTPLEIRRILNSRKTKAIVLNKPVAVHMIYRTAWVDRFGNIQFRKDIYGFDERSMPILEKMSLPLVNKEINEF